MRDVMDVQVDCCRLMMTVMLDELRRHLAVERLAHTDEDDEQRRVEVAAVASDDESVPLSVGLVDSVEL